MEKKQYIIFLGLAFELVTLVIGFLYAGRYFDERFQLAGIGVTAGAILAIAIWVTHIYFALKTKDNG